MEKAIFAGGCFWCTEYEFRKLDGVIDVRPGYIGGKTENPTYEQVCTGRTGHAEAVEITFDPARISYEALALFFMTKGHNPTEMNRQWVDVGTQYRSAIFARDEAQRSAAQSVIDRLIQEKRYDRPIVTKIEAAGPFWPAEDYHKRYYEKYEAKTGTAHQRVLARHSD